MHRQGLGGDYTAARLPVELVWCEAFQFITDAIAAERRIKGWSRAKKEAMIRGDWDALPALSRRRGGKPLLNQKTQQKRVKMTTNTQPAPASAYDLSPNEQAEQSATFALLVDNEPGVLHRVVGLFAARGYNIESLTVAETDRKAHTSRITVVTRGTRQVLDQIEAQLNKVVNVRRVHDVTRDPNGVERELALVKVRGVGADRVEALRIAEIFRAKPVDTTLESFVFEVSGAPSKIDKFLDLMRPLGLVELSRTGVLSIERGVEGM